MTCRPAILVLAAALTLAGCSPPPDSGDGQVVAGHSGTILLESVGVESAGGLTVVIPKGTELPARYTNVFSNQVDSQTAVELRLRTQEGPIPDRVIGSFQIDSIAPAPKGQAKIRITFTAGPDGTLTITAKDQGGTATDSSSFPGLVVARKR